MSIARIVIVATLASVLAACSTTSTRTPTPNTADASIDKRDSPQSTPRERAAIRLQLAIGYYQDGRYSVALDELKQADALDPTYPEVQMMVAMVYTELGEDARADQSFQRALQLGPLNPDVNNNYGWYLCQRGREKDSLVYFENALKDPLYTQKAKPLQNAGVCSKKMGDAVLAETYFRRSFEIDPGGAVAAYNLAQLYYDRQDFSRARFYVSQVNNGPVPSAASLWLGIRIERRLGNKTNEVALENQLERLFGDSREAQLKRRGVYSD